MKKLSFKTMLVAVMGLLVLAGAAEAATSGAQFQAAYQFFYDAATGYLGRAIAIVGGLIGLGMGAASGKALPAVLGVILACFGAFGPTIINDIFGVGAVI